MTEATMANEAELLPEDEVSVTGPVDEIQDSAGTAKPPPAVRTSGVSKTSSHQNASVVVLQALFRGHLARKYARQMRLEECEITGELLPMPGTLEGEVLEIESNQSD